MHSEEQIKAKAMCLFYQDGKILVSRGRNKVTNEIFYRLLGGSLNFFENSEAGIRREIQEELHSDIENLKFITTIENTFTHEDWRGHEIVFVYLGDLKRKELYEQNVIHIVEETYEFDAEWIPVRDVIKGTKILFPSFDWKSLFQKMRDNFGAKEEKTMTNPTTAKIISSKEHAELVKTATKNIKDIVNLSIKFDASSSNKALVVYDTQNGLTNILVEAYRQALPGAKFVDFDTVNKETIMADFNAMQPNDLVVLIQTSNFRLDDFRIRIHLYSRKLKVIEHMHLYRNNEDVWDVYVNSLEYDTNWYGTVGHKLQQKLSAINELKIISPDTELVITGGLEMPKLNIGDYTGMENIGGTFPIGEVFTEGKDFQQMSGSFRVYAFANQDFSISMQEPFRVDVKEGLVVGYSENTPESFIKILELIKTFERPLIREIGFGLNRAITKERYLGDITAFERILGMHLSLGEKHSVYKKKGIKTNKSKFHVDLFPVVETATADNEIIFQNGKYLV